jgi:hypothetical protein
MFSSAFLLFCIINLLIIARSKYADIHEFYFQFIRCGDHKEDFNSKNLHSRISRISGNSNDFFLELMNIQKSKMLKDCQ